MCGRLLSLFVAFNYVDNGAHFSYLKGYFTHLTLTSKISHIDKLMNQ